MKKIKLLCLSISLFSLFTACNETEEVISAPSSNLRGTFINSEVITTNFSSSLVNDSNYLYCTLYPQSLIPNDPNRKVLYRIDQRLKLNKNYTYNYEYSIKIGNGGDWGNLEIAKLHVNITGTFTYTNLYSENGEIEENSYTVNLSNPTGGEEKIYGSNLPNPNDFYSWTMHSEPDLVLDFASLSKLDNYQFDQYVKERKVFITKAINENEENIIEDNVFYPFIMNDLGRFSTY